MASLRDTLGWAVLFALRSIAGPLRGRFNCIAPEALRVGAREKVQVAMAGGLGPLAGRVLRIGHLGDMNEPMILGALAGIEAAMTVQKIPYGPNGMAAAIAYLAQHTP